TTPSPTQTYTLSLHDALPISNQLVLGRIRAAERRGGADRHEIRHEPVPRQPVRIPAQRQTGGQGLLPELPASDRYPARREEPAAAQSVRHVPEWTRRDPAAVQWQEQDLLEFQLR